nr:MAG TPA: hypothetical protein [Caudoviricetes sp.]
MIKNYNFFHRLLIYNVCWIFIILSPFYNPEFPNRSFVPKLYVSSWIVKPYSVRHLYKIKVKSLIIAPRRLRQDARGVAFYDAPVSDINVGDIRESIGWNS